MKKKPWENQTVKERNEELKELQKELTKKTLDECHSWDEMIGVANNVRHNIESMALLDYLQKQQANFAGQILKPAQAKKKFGGAM